MKSLAQAKLHPISILRLVPELEALEDILDSSAQPIIASRIGEPWNACLYNFSSWPDCSLLCLQWQCPGLALRLPWVRSVSTVLACYPCVSTVSTCNMLHGCFNSANVTRVHWAESMYNMWPVQLSPVLAGGVWDGVTGAAMELSPPAGGNILTLEMLLSVTSRGQYSHISHELPAPCRARRAVAPLTALWPVSGRARPRHGASPG